MRRAGGGDRPTHGAERVQKALARAGLASRREAEAWIRAGRLTINGALATLGARIAPGDELRLDGRTVHVRAPPDERAFLCHRSPGEPLIEPGRMPRRLGRRLIAVSPMPRADGGLELLTSDGDLAARLQRGVHALSSEFSVRVRGELSDAQIRGVLGGELDSGARLTVGRCESAGGEGANRWYQIAVQGASGRELRQLLERQGAQVSRLLRTRLGPLALERSLGRGRFRELSQEELRALLSGAAEDEERAGG
jgi:23S rRNA pseudouridine2605 synthase